MSYRVKVGISYPATPEVEAALRAAAELPEEERQAAVAEAFASGGMKHAEPGALVDDLPALSLPWLLEQGLIEAYVPAPSFGAPDSAAKSPVLGEAKSEGHG